MGLLQRLFTRASLENPKVSLYDSKAIDAEFGWDRETTSSVRVTDKKALGFPPLWRAINLISSDVAKLPLNVYRQKSDGSKETDRKHPASRLVRRMANPQMAAKTFRRTLTFHALFFGNGYGAIYRNGLGEPKELVVLSPCTFQTTENGRLVYKTTLDNKVYTIDATDVIHIRNLSPDGKVGFSVIDLMKDALGTALAVRDFASKWFANGATASGLLQIEGAVEPQRQKQIMKDFASIASGMKNAHGVALIQNGARWIPLTIDPEKSQMLELQRFTFIDTANIFGVPPHKINGESSSYASEEQKNQSYLNECLGHWLDAWETELWCKLLSPEEQEEDTHFLEFNQAALLKADLLTRYTAYNIGIQTGIIVRNEARSAENYPPVEYGDEVFVPANMIPLKKVFEEPKEAPEPVEPAVPAEPAEKPQDVPPEQQPDVVSPADEGVHLDDLTRQSFVALVEDRIKRLSAVERTAVVRAATKEKNFLAWFERFVGEQQARYVEALTFALSPWFVLHRAGVGAIESTVPALVAKRLQALRTELLQVTGSSTRQTLEQNVSALRCWSLPAITAFAEELLESVNERAAKIPA